MHDAVRALLYGTETPITGRKDTDMEVQDKKVVNRGECIRTRAIDMCSKFNRAQRRSYLPSRITRVVAKSYGCPPCFPSQHPDHGDGLMPHHLREDNVRPSILEARGALESDAGRRSIGK